MEHGHPSRQPIPFGLSLAAGGGLTLMIIALGLGVVNADAAESGGVGFLFIAGLLLLIAGVGAWLAVTRPFANFDDINVAKDTGHGHGHDSHEEELLLPDGMEPVPTAALPAGGEHAAATSASGHAH